MIDFLKISRNSQILEIVLDPPKAVNSVKEFESAKVVGREAWEGRMMTPGGTSPDKLLLALAQYPNKPPRSIEGMNVCPSAKSKTPRSDGPRWRFGSAVERTQAHEI